jgi:hypothetical protein
MKNRCYHPGDAADRRNYMDKGITICDEWRYNFDAFVEWSLANGWAPGLSIDRINGNGNYEPGNCRWVTMKVQLNNTARNVKVTHDGQTKTISEWCDFYKISYRMFQHRISRSKMTLERAFSTFEKLPVKDYEYMGEFKSLRSWAKLAGIGAEAAYSRVRKMGHTIQELFKFGQTNYQDKPGGLRADIARYRLRFMLM